MSPEMITALSGLILGIGSMVVALLSRRDQAKKSEVEILQAIIETQDNKIKELQADNDRFKAEISRLGTIAEQNRKEAIQLRAWVAALSKQVKELGQVPVGPPAE